MCVYLIFFLSQVITEISFSFTDVQLHLEGMNKVSDQPIKHEKDSQGHCDLRDMAGSSSEAMSHQEPVEEIPLDRSGEKRYSKLLSV